MGTTEGCVPLSRPAQMRGVWEAESRAQRRQLVAASTRTACEEEEATSEVKPGSPHHTAGQLNHHGDRNLEHCLQVRNLMRPSLVSCMPVQGTPLHP